MISLPLLFLFSLGVTHSSPSDFLDRSRTLLHAGQAEKALTTALTGLEYQPEDLALLRVAASAAEIASRRDEALMLLDLALQAAQVENTKKAVFEELSKRRAALDPLGGQSTVVADKIRRADLQTRRKMYQPQALRQTRLNS